MQLWMKMDQRKLICRIWEWHMHWSSLFVSKSNFCKSIGYITYSRCIFYCWRLRMKALDQQWVNCFESLAPFVGDMMTEMYKVVNKRYWHTSQYLFFLNAHCLVKCAFCDQGNIKRLTINMELVNHCPSLPLINCQSFGLVSTL